MSSLKTAPYTSGVLMFSTSGQCSTAIEFFSNTPVSSEKFYSIAVQAPLAFRTASHKRCGTHPSVESCSSSSCTTTSAKPVLSKISGQSSGSTHANVEKTRSKLHRSTAFRAPLLPSTSTQRCNGTGCIPEVTLRKEFCSIATERVCCLLVLDSVTSTPQWIRQPKRDVVHDVCVCLCVNMCSEVLGLLSP